MRVRHLLRLKQNASDQQFSALIQSILVDTNLDQMLSHRFSIPLRRGGRVAEGARFEIVWRLIPAREFESLPLRHSILRV